MSHCQTPGNNDSGIVTFILPAPTSGSIQLGLMNSRRKVEMQLNALQQDISKTHKLLSDIGWFSGMTTMTEQQRQLAVEYKQKKDLYDRYRKAFDQVPSQVNVSQNGRVVTSNPAASLAHGRLSGQACGPNDHRPPGVNVQQVTPRTPSAGPAVLARSSATAHNSPASIQIPCVPAQKKHKMQRQSGASKRPV